MSSVTVYGRHSSVFICVFVIIIYSEAVADTQDYEARSNIMWTATWALNTLFSRGKSIEIYLI